MKGGNIKKMEQEQQEEAYINSDKYEYEPDFDEQDTGFARMDLRTCEWY